MVSMGQGQEIIARKMMSDCMTAGGWVLLQNVHLSLPFCSEIIDILVETEHVDDNFRLWVTTEVHEEFPIGLLQMAIKFTNEPPQGIRASLKRSYQVMYKPTRRFEFYHFQSFFLWKNEKMSLFIKIHVTYNSDTFSCWKTSFFQCFCTRHMPFDCQ